MDNLFIKKSGATISFTEYNAEGQTLIFIHNAGGNRHFMEKQARYFGKLGYHVLNIDLPGHGESPMPKEEYKIENVARDIIELCKELGIERAALVGLNYGGIIATEVASASNIATHIILIDPPMLMLEWTIQLVSHHVEELISKPNNNFAKDLVNSVLLNGTPKDRQMATNSFNNIF